MSRAAHRANRVAVLGGFLVALMITIVLGSSPAAAGTAGTSPKAPGASASIINGKATTIERWPWQVALTVGYRVAPKLSTTQRAFCGGAILAPRLVVTAGHCVIGLKKKQIRQIEIVSGRTNLNSNRGEIARVSGLRIPVNALGKRRYRTVMGAADWDVALLTLASPLAAEPIKLAGPDEAATWRPGRIAWTTGWGITRPFSSQVPSRLQRARQVLMNNGLCRRSDGVSFQAARMICLGGSHGHASTCGGDSGGPLVVKTTAGFRLVGLTSFGDGACRAVIPSVDTRVSGDPIRRWIAKTASNLTGADVLGSGATAGPVPEWCQVPSVFGLKPAQARRKLEARNCRLGAIRTDHWAVGRKGRIVGYSRLPGWFAPPGFRLKVWIAP